MGNNSSTSGSTDIGTSVYSNSISERHTKEIEEDLKSISELSIGLAEQYHSDFLRPDFCNRVAMVSKQKLGYFSEQRLEGIAEGVDSTYTLGMVASDPGMKEKLCDTIVDHYMKRVNLISTILTSLDECSDRVKALVSGPICLSNPDIFDEEECKKMGGAESWLENYNISFGINDQSIHNKPFFNKMEELNQHFMDNLKKVKTILDQLKQKEYMIKPEDLEKMQEDTQKLLFVMKEGCRRLYYDALLNPPHTDREISELDRENTLKNTLNLQTQKINEEQEKMVKQIENDVKNITVG
jgi:hypothetical protein